MEISAVLRMMGALAIVLGILVGALWLVKRYNIRLPGRMAPGGLGRLELVERVMLDNKRAVALVRRDGREHLILLSPEGQTVIETGVMRDAIDEAAAEKRAAEAAAARAQAEADAEKARQELQAAIASAKERASRVKGQIGVAARQRAASAKQKAIAAKARMEGAAQQARSLAAKVNETGPEPVKDWLAPAALPTDAPAAAEPAPETPVDPMKSKRSNARTPRGRRNG